MSSRRKQKQERKREREQKQEQPPTSDPAAWGAVEEREPLDLAGFRELMKEPGAQLSGAGVPVDPQQCGTCGRPFDVGQGEGVEYGDKDGELYLCAACFIAATP